jgi:hypothetical protein
MVHTAMRAPRGVRIGAPDDDRRMWFLNGFRIGDHWAEIDKSAAIFRPILRPDRSHGFDALLHELMTCSEGRAVVSHLLFVPAIADAEEETFA